MIKKAIHYYKRYKTAFYLFSGFLLSLLLMTPYFLLGTGSYFEYHDQLDGELLNYILAAKYFLTGTDIYPEILNGLPITGAMMPAPLFVLFFVILNSFAAFLCCQWVIYLVSYLGMFLLLRKLGLRYGISFLTAIIFMILPFYPVYGLCIPGQPLLFWTILCLYDQERLSLRSLPYLALILLYSLCSSLILVGFACVTLLGCICIYNSVKEFKKRRCFPFHLWSSLLTLIGGYLICNLSLIKQVLFPTQAEVSHKAELLVSAQGFLSSLREALYPGIRYAMSWPFLLLPLIGITIILFMIAKIRQDQDVISHMLDRMHAMLPFFFLIAIIILLYGIYNSSLAAAFFNSRNGAQKSFNLGRIAWLLPTFWCVLAAYLADTLLLPPRSSAASTSVTLSLLPKIFILGLFGLWGCTILLHSPYKLNLSKLVKTFSGEDYYILSWDKFYAEDIYTQIDESIHRPKEEYKVASLGIYPAATAYNGFYCIDGYSNNYPLQYKHNFREIIADELDKADYIRLYYDNWGNRCFLLTAEYGSYFTVEKKWNGGFHDLSLNISKMKELGCEYLFSATWIQNAEDLGLEWLDEKVFSSPDSWYNIYVYKII